MSNVVQIKDKKTGFYIKVDRETGRVLRKKTTLGPYKRIEIVDSVEVKAARKYTLSKSDKVLIGSGLLLFVLIVLVVVA